MKSILALIILCSWTLSAAASELTLEPRSFAAELGRLALKGRSCVDLRKDLRAARALQNAMLEDNVEAYGDQSIPILSKLVTRSLVMHSLPLIPAGGLPYEGLDVLGNLGYFVNESAMGRAQKDLVNDPDLAARMKPSGMVAHYGQPQYLKTEASVMQNYLRVVNPLAAWLIEQKPGSVTPLALAEKASSLTGGNLIYALGVIGQMFDQERMNLNGPRRTLAVLGSRVTPLEEGKLVNPIGVNYHFWSYLNMNLIEPEELSRVFSLGYERIYQGDLEEYYADQAGISAGMRLHRILRSCN